MQKKSKTNVGDVTRRSAIQAAAGINAAVISAMVAPAFATGAAASPTANSDRLKFAQIGVGGNGRNNAAAAQAFSDLVAICDVDSKHLQEANELLTGGKAATYADYREVLAREDIDFVVISTPDHWHTKILVEAMRAGKDAYCEKPLTLTIDEGKLIRKVQKETGQVVQVGTQQRSMFSLFVKAIAMINEGRLGKLKRVQAAIGAGAWSPEIPLADVPESLDWDRWLGPAPKTEYRYIEDKKYPHPYTNSHVFFRWWYQYSGGKLTDWGAHHIDIAMRGIEAAGQNSDPVSVDGTAMHMMDFVDGNPTRDDLFNTAREFNLTVKFADDDVELVIRHDTDNGILFEGELGKIFVNRGKLVGKPVEDLVNNPLPDDALSKAYRDMPMELDGRPAHHLNFLHAIENRILPISDVHSHMKMLNVCHLAGICCRLGRKINWDQKTEQIVGDPQAAAMMQRPYRAGYEIE